MIKTLTIGAIATIALTGCAVPVALPTATETVEVPADRDTDGDAITETPQERQDEIRSLYRDTLPASMQDTYDVTYDAALEVFSFESNTCEASSLDASFYDDVEMWQDTGMLEVEAVATTDAMWLFCEWH